MGETGAVGVRPSVALDRRSRPNFTLSIENVDPMLLCTRCRDINTSKQH